MRRFQKVVIEVLAIAIVLIFVLYIRKFEIEFATEEYKHLYDILMAGVLIVLAGYVSLRTGLSTSILELLFGGLGRLLGITPTGTLAFLAEIGAIMLMFIAGTEIDINILKKKFKESVLLGSLIFLVPFITLTITHVVWKGALTHASILLGIALGATSVAVVYTILYDILILYSPLGQILFSGAMICDVISVLALSIALEKFSMLSLFYPLVLLALFLLVPKASRIIITLKSSWEFELKIILLLMVMLAVVSSALGVHAALTAFLLGVLIAESAREHKILHEKIKGLGFGFFIPIFFFYSGLLIDFTALTALFPFFMLLLILSFGGTYLGALIAVKLCCPLKFKKILVVFNAKTSITIIVAYEGLRAGLIDPVLYSLITLVALTSAILVTLILRVTPTVSMEDLAL